MGQGENQRLVSKEENSKCMKWMSLIASGLAHAMMASNLIYYVYTNDIKIMFKYNQTEVELFAAMLNTGIGLGFLPNMVVRKLTSKCVLIFGMILSTLGLLLLWSTDTMISFYEGKSWLMAFYFLLIGFGSSVAYIMSLRSNAIHFSEDKRGHIGALMFIFIFTGMISLTLIYNHAFEDSMRFHGFLIVLVSFNAGVYLFCVIFLRSPTPVYAEVFVEKETDTKHDFNYLTLNGDIDVHLPERSFKELLKSPDFHLLTWFCSLTFAVSLLLSNNMTVLTRGVDMSSFDTIITLIYPPLVLATSLTFSYMSDRFKMVLSRISFLIFGAICFVFCSILNAFFSWNEPVLAITLVLGGTGSGIVSSVGPTAMSEFCHNDNFMRNWGVVMFFRAGIVILLHVVFGAFYDMEMSSADARFCQGIHCTRYGYIMTGSVAIISIVLGLSLIKRTNKRLNEQIQSLETQK